jgi:hypothetical protein
MSQSVQDFWGQVFRDEDRFIPFIMICVFVSSTASASMLLPNLPPTAIVFCGLMAFFVHYAVTMLAAITLQSRRSFSPRNFAVAYGVFFLSVSLLLLVIAVLRLRKLTERN